MADFIKAPVWIRVDGDPENVNLHGEVTLPTNLYRDAMELFHSEEHRGSTQEDATNKTVDMVADLISVDAYASDRILDEVPRMLVSLFRRTVLETLSPNAFIIQGVPFVTTVDVSEVAVAAASLQLDRGAHVEAIVVNGAAPRPNLDLIPQAVVLIQDIWEEPFRNLSPDSSFVLAKEAWSRIDRDRADFIIDATERGIGASAQMKLSRDVRNSIDAVLSRDLANTLGAEKVPSSWSRHLSSDAID